MKLRGVEFEEPRGALKGEKLGAFSDGQVAGWSVPLTPRLRPLLGEVVLGRPLVDLWDVMAVSSWLVSANSGALADALREVHDLDDRRRSDKASGLSRGAASA